MIRQTAILGHVLTELTIIQNPCLSITATVEKRLTLISAHFIYLTVAVRSAINQRTNIASTRTVTSSVILEHEFLERNL